MNLNTRDWKEFVLEKLFTIKKGKRLTSADQEDGTNNYIGAIDSNNGVANHIAQAPIHKGNTISLSYNGSVGEAFYQKEPYWATDDVNALYSKYEGFNEPIGLFFAAVLRQEKYKFSYGRKWTLENMNSTVIKLPIKHNKDGTVYIDAAKKYSDRGYVPDWQWMEDYIKSLHHKPLATQNKRTDVAQLDIAGWKEFVLGRLFKVELSKGDIKLDDVDKGRIPLVSSGESNNGIVGYIDEKGDGKAEIFKGNKITVDMFGNPFYQDDDFYAVSHGRVNILEPKFELNKPIGLFISSIIKKEQYKFSYGRAVYSTEASNMIIELPVQHNDDGTPCIDVNRTYSDEGYIPDWTFMENYIISLPYGDRL
ncbi:MAG: restriction endonuclease subunit S [Clostridia bacterium]|nr:restriction endonuclease subunit S [Clostridia bacterium]